MVYWFLVTLVDWLINGVLVMFILFAVGATKPDHLGANWVLRIQELILIEFVITNKENKVFPFLRRCWVWGDKWWSVDVVGGVVVGVVVGVHDCVEDMMFDA